MKDYICIDDKNLFFDLDIRLRRYNYKNNIIEVIRMFKINELKLIVSRGTPIDRPTFSIN